MMDALLILLAAIAGLVVTGLAESIVHRRNLARIPIRVHVNGTRGKSSVTRLIAAGLRAGGLRTCAKTTGTLPRAILPEGSELPIIRNSRPNIIEQRDFIRQAARQRAEAVVVECMALQPWLQWICESKLIRATHGVITNVRPDHLDVMGPDDAHVACALANTTPLRGVLLTAERKHAAVLAHAARDRRSRFVLLEPDDLDDVSADELAPFPYTEHRENVALALRVCLELGVDRDTALEGMWQVQPDPGATTTHVIESCGRRLAFVNAFAANDPLSSEQAWHAAIDRFAGVERRIALLNCRADRPDRSAQLAQACLDWSPADAFVLIGTGIQAFVRSAVAGGLDPRKVLAADQQSTADLFETLVDVGGRSALIVGLGNIGDNGLNIERFFRNRSLPLCAGFDVEQPPSRSEDMFAPATVPREDRPLELAASSEP